MADVGSNLKNTDETSPAKNILLHSADLSMTGEERAAMTLAAKDCEDLPRVKLAGRTVEHEGEKAQVMHNGLLVIKGAYQGEWQAEVIEGQKGVHEPQEEKVFNEVLKRVPSGGVMMELGSWWSYYSMWFLKEVDEPFVICCEPDLDNLKVGKANMSMNSFKEGDDFIFYHSAAGSKDKKEISFRSEPYKEQTDVLVRTVDSILDEQGVGQLSILHMDIQGAELDALKGAERAINDGLIRFVFISTHHYVISDDPLIHQKCLDFVTSHGGSIVTEHTIAESASGDGLIVASFDQRDKDFSVEVGLQHSSDSLFRQPERDVGVLWNGYNELVSKMGDMDKEIERREELIQAQRERLNWISAHPVRFTLRNIYNRYIKRGIAD